MLCICAGFEDLYEKRALIVFGLDQLAVDLRSTLIWEKLFSLFSRCSRLY